MSDLLDAEFAELDDLLAGPPEPLRALDAVMLDGYLCGVLVQPEPLEPARWLPPIFDYDGQELPAGVLDTLDAAWWTRTRILIERRHAALRRAIAEDGGFDPFVLEFDEEAGEAEGAEPMPEALAALPPVSRALMPWVAGFQHAMGHFPGLTDTEDSAVMSTLARLYRHLPPTSDEERELVATVDRLQPLKSLDDGIEDLIAAVVELSDLTEAQRYRVETVRRDAPKVGRNDACPCGSGRKYKHCHGAS